MNEHDRLMFLYGALFTYFAMNLMGLYIQWHQRRMHENARRDSQNDTTAE